MSNRPKQETEADAVLDAKLREIWDLLSDKPEVLRDLRRILPASFQHVLGCDFQLTPKDNWTEYIIWRDGKLPENEATTYLQTRFRNAPLVMIDVGANVGAFSLPILKAAGADAKAFLVEPNPELRRRLHINIDLNDLSNIHVLPFAISDREDRSFLHFPIYGNFGQGRLDTAYHDRGDRIQVDMRPLPKVVKDNGLTRIDLLKVDVEGLEDRVIAPLLQDTDCPLPDMIYFETEHQRDWRHPLMDLLRARGFVLLRDFGQNALFQRERSA